MASMPSSRSAPSDRSPRSGPVPADPPVGAEPEDISPVVQVLDHVSAAGHVGAWNGLLDRCLEDTVFLDPAFCLTAAAQLAGREPPRFVMVWAGGPLAERNLIAVCPVMLPRNPLRRLASLWVHDFAAIGLPLLDRDRARVGLEALMAWMAEALPGRGAVLFESIPGDGPTAVLLGRVAETTQRGLVVVRHWRRAVLRAEAPPDHAGLAALSSKGGKEARRQARRLAELGRLDYASLRATELDDAAEQFLVLEANGWKGRGGTALIGSDTRAAFARIMIRRLGDEGRCRIERLALDGVPIAMAVVLSCGRTDYLWKIAYAEDLARFSPGVRLLLEFSERQKRDGLALVTDSCAVPDHPMIDRLWRDRLDLQDIAVGLVPGRHRAFRSAVTGERLWRTLRAAAKAALNRWRRSRQ